VAANATSPEHIGTHDKYSRPKKKHIALGDDGEEQDGSDLENHGVCAYGCSVKV